MNIQRHPIEPGEIEARLAAHPAVRRAAVVAREDSGAGRRLVAYVVAATASSNDGTEACLRRFLRERWPGGVIPAAFVFLLELPLTANGRIDVKALPDPSRTAFAAGGSDTAPATQAEEILFALWRRALPATAFGIHDEFAALGGNPLIGARLMARVREIFGIEAPARFIFEHPTVARMAAAVEDLLLDDMIEAAPNQENHA